MDPAQNKIIQNHVDHATAEATKKENERCMAILEMAIKSPHAASDAFLSRMSFALDCMSDKSCHWSAAKTRFAKMESGADPTAIDDPEDRTMQLAQNTLRAGKAAKAPADLQEEVMKILDGDRSFVRP